MNNFDNSNGYYTSMSGADIHAVFGNYKFGTIQMLKYASSREVAPIYTMGSPSVRAFARGKRSINGAFVFSMLDKGSLVSAMANAGGTNRQIFLNNDEVANYANYANDSAGLTEQQQIALNLGGSISSDGVLKSTGTTATPYAQKSIWDASNFGVKHDAILADQILPFDITLVGLPEYGSVTGQRLIIEGVQITTEASGTSIDDMVIEKQHAFVARNIAEWASLESQDNTGTLTSDRFANYK